MRCVILDMMVEAALVPWLKKPQALIIQDAWGSPIPHIIETQSPALMKRIEVMRITPIVCDNRILF